MSHICEYRGFHIDVSVEADFIRNASPTATDGVKFVAIVEIRRAGTAVALFSPLRFGDSKGKPFACEAEALTGAYSAGRRIVDDLLTS